MGWQSCPDSPWGSEQTKPQHPPAQGSSLGCRDQRGFRGAEALRGSRKQSASPAGTPPCGRSLFACSQRGTLRTRAARGLLNPPAHQGGLRELEVVLSRPHPAAQRWRAADPSGVATGVHWVFIKPNWSHWRQPCPEHTRAAPAPHPQHSSLISCSSQGSRTCGHCPSLVPDRCLIPRFSILDPL